MEEFHSFRPPEVEDFNYPNIKNYNNKNTNYYFALTEETTN